MNNISLSKKLGAEFFGTFWLVFGGCGSAVLAAGIPELGIGFVGVSLAFGLTVLTMAYAVGHISGGHFNPAVTLGLVAGGRFNAKDAGGYIAAQVIGGIAAAAVLYVIASGNVNFDAVASGFASRLWRTLTQRLFNDSGIGCRSGTNRLFPNHHSRCD